LNQLSDTYFYYGYNCIQALEPLLGDREKALKLYSTRRVFDKLGFRETNIILIEMMKQFRDHMFDMFVLSPTKAGKVEVRLAGYHF